MPKEKLLELRSGKGLDSGMFPSAEPSTGTVWSFGKNVWFKELHVEHKLGATKLLNFIGRPSQVIAQANVDSMPRVYYDDLGIISYYQDGETNVIGSLDSTGNVDLEPYGTWLLATDGIGLLKLWKNTGTFITAGDVESQFSTCKIIKRLAQHVIAYGTDVYPSGFHWCSASNVELWTPAANNSAGNLPIRDLDSDIIAVENLGAAHAVYSENTMLPVQYVGPNNWFGTPNQALSGIGAVSKHSVVSLGKFNWGMSRTGIFLTDGSTMMFVDRPAVDRWLQENVDWTRKNEISGYYDAMLSLIVWVVPLITGGRTTIAVDPKNKTSLIDNGKRTFTFLGDDIVSGAERVVLSNPLIAKQDGLYLESVAGKVAGDFQLTSQLFDAGAADFYKLWDYVILEGRLSGQIRIGFADEPSLAAIQWNSWVDMAYQIPLQGRESIYVALDFKTDSVLRLSAISVYGEKGGLVT